MKSKTRNALLSSLLIASVGCVGLLPSKTINTHTNWSDYRQLEFIANDIRVGQTLNDLKGIGIDVHNTENIHVLTHLDVAKRFGLIGMKDPNLITPTGVQRMLAAAEKGRGYELIVESTVEQHEGSFWKNFLGFKKVKRTTGWKFSVLIITVDGSVQYVLHKGNPNINSLVVEKRPLGPFQNLNGYVVVDLLEEVIE